MYPRLNGFYIGLHSITRNNIYLLSNLTIEYHCECLIWSRNFLLFVNIWTHARFLVESVLLLVLLFWVVFLFVYLFIFILIVFVLCLVTCVPNVPVSRLSILVFSDVYFLKTQQDVVLHYQNIVLQTINQKCVKRQHYVYHQMTWAYLLDTHNKTTVLSYFKKKMTKSGLNRVKYNKIWHVYIYIAYHCIVGYNNDNITWYFMWNMRGSTYHKKCRPMVPGMWWGSMFWLWNTFSQNFKSH